MRFLEHLVSLAVILGLFVWHRIKSKKIGKEVDQKIDAVKEIVQAVQIDAKDFHERLKIIEKKNS